EILHAFCLLLLSKGGCGGNDLLEKQAGGHQIHIFIGENHIITARIYLIKKNSPNWEGSLHLRWYDPIHSSVTLAMMQV
ncbi:hypothetical protein ACNHG4_20980, partial [Bacillus paralicheniformis]|uniref:hypothetical protein n=1 Tax=Bacillus paralicheniformis TaxID=1648923 RepID=UPI003A8B04FB